ncbi:MAG: VCBS repeat-containing protein [Gudongella sp.]|jgi:hypothetical protein|nr:VCBS repeat-containing protein [Gudongella sp.]
MDKKEGNLIKNEKYSVELIKAKNEEYANKMVIKSLENNKDSFTKDISDLNVWKLEVGDIDGDGIDEVALGVYRESPLHPIVAKRPYIYTFNGEELIPKWRGSRLSRPFVDFVFYDIDNDGWDEIISIEILKDSAYIINSYKWKGFGFEGYLESKELQTIPKFHIEDNYVYIETTGEEEYLKLEINKENEELEWRMEDES